MRLRNGRPWGWKFIDLAALGSNTARSYVVTVLRVVVVTAAFLVLAFAAIFLAVQTEWLPAPVLRLAVVGMAFASVGVAGGALAWGVARTHRRPWLSLISADLTLDWRRLAIGAGVEGTLLLAFLCLGHLITGQPWRLGSATSPGPLAVLVLLVPFQAASEEMLFRGYLTQALGRIIRNRAMIAVAVAAIFGAMHLGAYGVLTVPYLFGLSLVFSLVSLRDERLELTIGAHTAMNWFAIGAGDVLGADAGAVRLKWAALALLVVHGALLHGLTRSLVHRCCEPRPAR